MIGNTLGHYKVTSHLGSGGMGDVYEAMDTKLGRTVAIKLLPEVFAHDTERVARFEREARVLASLNHSNIAAIYGLEQAAGQRFLVMELVPGETLAERIKRGPIAADEALGIARQIAEALEAAHDSEKGIVHRDLKPANVKITPEGKVKVLDFGLAKAYEVEPSANLSSSPTLVSMSAMSGGVILGTAAYMSPEQARGRKVDRRTDVWAFGCVLYEMLTGRRAFEGEDLTEILGRVVTADPDWSRLPAATPTPIQKMLRRALKKDLRQRLGDIHDARLEIEDSINEPAALPAPALPAARRSWMSWIAAILAVVATVSVVAWFLRSSPALPGAVAKLEFPLPQGQFLAHTFRHAAELSPDGKRIAFVANPLPGGPAAASKIYLRALDQWDATPVAGSEGGFNPFFSPDGDWLGFLIGVATSPNPVQMKKISLSGGSQVLTDKAESLGVSWGSNGKIVFAGLRAGLKWIPESGGEPQQLTELDSAANEISHRLPHFLPDGSGVLFTVLRYHVVTPEWKDAQTWVYSFKTGQRKRLLDDATDARYAEDGYIVFARQGKLFAAPFDVKTLSVKGPPVQMADDLTHSTYFGSGSYFTTGAAQFSLSRTGSLLYAPGSIEPANPNELVWMDRQGRATPLGTKPMFYLAVRVSPDGKQALFNEYHVGADLWVYDIARGTLGRQTFEGQNSYGIWSPDGKRITFRSSRGGPMVIYQQELGSHDSVQLVSSATDIPSSWSPDGRELAFVRVFGSNDDSSDIYILSTDKPNTARPLLNTRFAENYPEFSPDGHWLAYCSNESGRSELYVRPYPDPGRPVLVSTDGATEPAWSRDGKELFYRSGSKMMSVRFKVSGVAFIPETPVELFEARMGGSSNVRGYDVAPDGRFLVKQQPPADKLEERLRKIYPSTLRLVLNWTRELDRSANGRR